MGCLAIIVKYTLFIVNLLITLAGLAIVGLGVFLLFFLNNVSDGLPGARAVSIAVLVAGAVIFLFAFFGCCGAITENRCLLITYATLTAILVGVQIYVLVVSTRELSDVRSTVDNWIYDFFARPDSREVFYAIEYVFKCCGTTGYESYEGILQYRPPTCCPGFDFGSIDLSDWGNNIDLIETYSCSEANAFGGCTITLTDWLDTFATSLIWVLAVILAIEVVAFVMALILCSSITSKMNRKPTIVYYRH